MLNGSSEFWSVAVDAGGWYRMLNGRSECGSVAVDSGECSREC